MGSLLRCGCGNLLRTNLYSGAGVIKFILDEDFDRLAEPFEPETVRELFLRGPTAYHCPQCGRLHVE